MGQPTFWHLIGLATLALSTPPPPRNKQTAVPMMLLPPFPPTPPPKRLLLDSCLKRQMIRTFLQLHGSSNQARPLKKSTPPPQQQQHPTVALCTTSWITMEGCAAVR